MKQTFLSILLMLLPMLASADPVEIEGILYNLDTKAKEAEVTRDPNYYYSGSVDIPPSVTIDGIEYSVMSIGDYAFQSCNGLTSVTIPNSVTSIGDFAFFDCSSLTSITIGNSVKSIGNYAFEGCSNLTSVNIPNSVTCIGRNAFSGCISLPSIGIPNDVTSIENSTFEGCSRLLYVIIGNSVTSIGNSAFKSCSNLSSIVIPNSVTSIGYGAFHDCSNLISVSIGNSVSKIGNSAFRGCRKLSSVKIPNGVKEIGWHVFHDCSSLTFVDIPPSVTEIQEDAFTNCNSINAVYISDLEAWCKIEFDVEANFQRSHLYLNGKAITDLVIPDNITVLKNRVFTNLRDIKSITIPNSVSSIEGGVFSNCNGIESIIVENGNNIYDSRNNCNAIIKTESNALISGCRNTIIPNSVASIGWSAFSGCSGLTSVTIPNSVMSIGSSAFYNCSSLTTIISEIENPFTIDERIFYCYNKDVYGTATLIVPAGKKSAYQNAAGWSKFQNIEEAAVTQKCATPTISLENGIIKFHCETEGVEFVSEISINNTGKNILKVHATKAGFEDSAIVTAEFAASAIIGDLNSDRKVTVADHVELSKIIMNQQ